MTLFKTFSRSLFLATLGIIAVMPAMAGTDTTPANGLQSEYITENLHTYFRSGAGSQYRIKGSLVAGEPVTVLDNQGKYTLVRDSRNREGWVLTSELSTEPSSKMENPKLKAKIVELSNKLNSLDEAWQQRVQEMQRRTQQAEQQSSVLLQENTNLKRQMDEVNSKNRNLETMLDANKQAIAIQWFIYGGSVLGVGLLLGLLIPILVPRRRRRPSGWA